MMRGNGKLACVLACVDRVRLVLARPFPRKRRPSEEVQLLKQHLVKAAHDDVRLTEQTRRRERLVKDNHLVADVKTALGAHR